MIWCNTCCEHYDMSDFRVIKTEKGKTGRYRAYRDTLEWESYTFTEITLEHKKCRRRKKIEEDEVFHVGESDMQKYGYKGSNYGC